jgi:methylated-DNA-[protein]-cysteine S-methyltransferase
MPKEKKRPPAVAALATPLGHMFISVGKNGMRMVTGGRVRSSKNRDARPDPREAKELARAVKELREYFLGKRKRFTVRVDLSQGTQFQQKVWRELEKIPYGRVVSYGELARRIGRPGCARAVGQAVGSNPVGIIVPCHRVVAANGKIGGWSGSGGIAGKKALLRLEGIDLLETKKSRKVSRKG